MNLILIDISEDGVLCLNDQGIHAPGISLTSAVVDPEDAKAGYQPIYDKRQLLSFCMKVVEHLQNQGVQSLDTGIQAYG